MSNRDISECTVPELIELYGQRQRISLTRGKEEMMLAANAYSGPLARLALRPFHRPPAWQALEALYQPPLTMVAADINLVRPRFVRPAAFGVHHNGHSVRSDAPKPVAGWTWPCVGSARAIQSRYTAEDEPLMHPAG